MRDQLKRSGIFPVLALLCGLQLSPAWAQDLSFAGDVPSYHGFMMSLASLWQERGRGSIALSTAPTTQALRQAATGEATFGGSARTVDVNDRMERQVTQFPIAWDALAIIVHPDNPITNLRLQQLADVYRGYIQSWSALGGPDQPIVLLAHSEPRHGLDVTLASLLLRDSAADLGVQRRLESTDALIQAVEISPQALAVVNYSRARRARVKLLQVEGQAANPVTIQSGDYLLYFPLYLGVRSGTQSRRDIREFLRFASSNEARRVLRRNGVVPYPDGLALTSRQLERAGFLDGLRVDG